MTPIINPWWFYLFNLINNLKEVTSISIAVIGVIYLVAIVCCTLDEEIPEILKNSLMKTYLIFCLICSIILPSEKTMYQMASAALITPDNITTSANFVTDIVTDIISAVDEALED